jgi:hypothetical protein
MFVCREHFYIIKSSQFTPIPITPVRPGTHPRRKSRATCTVFATDAQSFLPSIIIAIGVIWDSARGEANAFPIFDFVSALNIGTYNLKVSSGRKL